MKKVTHKINDLLDVVSKKKSPPVCDKHMNISMVSYGGCSAEGKWYIDDSFLNGHGIVMGGFISGAVDIVMAYAIADLLKRRNAEDGSFASINLNVTYHRPLIKEEATIQAKVEQAGSTIAYVKGNIIQQEKVIATATSSFYLKV